MKSRTRAIAALLFALSLSAAVAGCSSSKLPSPSVDNSKSASETTSASVAASMPVVGSDTTITVAELGQKLRAEGLKVSVVRHDKPGVFQPAQLVVLNVDGTNVQTYQFRDAKQAYYAARTVDKYGFVVGYTPDELVSVNWAGWPAFFRSGDLIVIFVTGKDANAQPARDKRVFKAIRKIMGPQFIGGQTPPPTSTTPSSTVTSSVPASS